MVSSLSDSEKVINIGIFGMTNVGKCTLLAQLTFTYGNIDNPYDFSYNNVKYHSFPIPCTKPDYQGNYDISINNCDVVLLITSPYEEEAIDEEFYCGILRDAYVNNVLKIIICFNKCELNTNEEINKSRVEEIKGVITKYETQLKLIYSKNNIDTAYIDLSANEGLGIKNLLNELNATNTVKNNNNEDIIMSIHDSYEDIESSKMVISGKLLQGKAISIDTDLFSSSIKPVMICNCFNNYVNSISNNEFITLKFDLNQFNASIPNFNNNCLITSPLNKQPIPKFKIFEALIIFTSLPCSIISQGFKSMFKSGYIIQQCSIGKITKEAMTTTQPAKAKIFVVTELNMVYKAIISLTEDIYREKYEHNCKLGSFTLIYEGKTFACGKIVKYKPSV